jgi:hypothetical protein
MQANGTDANNALSPHSLSPIFERFFIPLLPINNVRRILDIFVLEGSKTIFRFGIALILYFKKRLKAELIKKKTGVFFWDLVSAYTHESTFDFDELMKVAFGSFGSYLRKRLSFPKRAFITRRNRVNEAYGEAFKRDNERFEFTGERDAPAFQISADRQGGPTTLVPAEIEENMRAATRLGSSEQLRFQLAQWVPPKMQSRKLELVYASDVDGKTLSNLYAATKSAGATITLVEVLATGEIVGMYASHSWHAATSVYGDGTCFVCKFGGGGVKYGWVPSSSSNGEEEEEDDDDDGDNHGSDQFMLSTSAFMLMGGNGDGSASLKLGEDLALGFSAESSVFRNAALVEGVKARDGFDTAAVEVYRFASPF